MSTCETCKNWRSCGMVGGAEFGECESRDERLNSTASFMLNGSNGLITRADYGCVAYERGRLRTKTRAEPLTAKILPFKKRPGLRLMAQDAV